jgi:tRNA nucleotidyltransferase/poly(A) polymerase
MVVQFAGKLQHEMRREDPGLFEVAQVFAIQVKKLPRLIPTITPHVRIVGGYARDVAWGVKPQDLDMEVYGVSPATLHRLVEDCFPGRVSLVGRHFETLKVLFYDGMHLDISLPRSRTNPQRGSFISGDPLLRPEEAVMQRDFTVNTISIDPITGKVYDYLGAFQDMKRRLLRVVDPDTFAMDPLRIMRAGYFCARYDLWPDSASFAVIRKVAQSGDLISVHPRRLVEELSKLLLMSKMPSIGCSLLRELGLVGSRLDAMLPTSLSSAEREAKWANSLRFLDIAARNITLFGKDLSNDEKLALMLSAILFSPSWEKYNPLITEKNSPFNELFSMVLFSRKIRKMVEENLTRIELIPAARRFSTSKLKTYLLNSPRPRHRRMVVSMTRQDIQRSELARLMNTNDLKYPRLFLEFAAVVLKGNPQFFTLRQLEFIETMLGLLRPMNNCYIG